MPNKKSYFVPPPPPTQPMVIPEQQAMPDYFGDLMQAPQQPAAAPQQIAQAQPQQQITPDQDLFGDMFPQQATQPTPQVQPAPVEQPPPMPQPVLQQAQPQMEGLPANMGPMGPQGQAAPQPIPQPIIAPRKTVSAPPAAAKPAAKPQPNEIQQAVQDVLSGADHFSLGVLHKMQELQGGVGKVAKGIVEGGKQRAEESHKYGSFSPEEAAASAAGLVHGPLSLAQDAYNGLVAAPAHLPAARFADQFTELPGVRVLAKNHPGAYGTASAGGGMAIPMGGAAKAATLGKTVLHGALGGAAFSGVGSAGQQYKETGKVDVPQAIEDAAVGGAIGTVMGAGMHGIGKAGEAIGSKFKSSTSSAKPGDVHQTGGPAPTPEPAKTSAAPQSRATTGQPRKQYDFISKEVHAQLAERDAQAQAAAAQEPPTISRSVLEHGAVDEKPQTYEPKNPPPEPAQLSPEEQARIDRTDYETKHFPLSQKTFKVWERTGGMNILKETWTPRDVNDTQLQDRLDQLNLKAAKEGKLKKSEEEEATALTQETMRRAQRKNMGLEVDWPQEALSDGGIPEKPEDVATPPAAPESVKSEPTTPDVLEQKPETPAAVETVKPTAKTPVIDMSTQSDAALADHFANGDDATQQAAIDEIIKRETAKTEAPNGTEKPAGITTPPATEYTYRKVAKGYEILDPEGKLHSSPRESEGKVIERVRKLNSGEVNANAGQRDSYKKAESVGAEQQKIVDVAKLPNTNHSEFSELASAKHAYDEIRAKYNAAYDAFLKAHPQGSKLAESLQRSKNAFKFDPAIERQVMSEFPGEHPYQIQNTRKVTGQYKPAKNKTPEQIARDVLKLREEMNAAEDAMYAAKKRAEPFFTDDAPILIPHEKGAITVRKVPRKEAQGRLHELLQTESEAYLDRQPTPLKKWLAGTADLIAEAYKPSGVSQVTVPGINQVMSAAKAVRTKYGAHLTPELAHKFLGNELNSDKYNRLADPAFNYHRNKMLGELDLALQHTEKLKTAEEKQAWQKNRYSPDESIRAGENDAHLLSPDQREALIKQNAVLNDLADLHEQYYEHLKSQGYDGKGPKSLVPGMNELAGTLRTDLEQLDHGQYGAKGALDEFGRKITSGIYDMYITGNWGVHELHAIEAASVGAAYHPIAFGEAVKSLATSKQAREYVDSFEASAGNMKAIREESDTILGKHWRGLQKALIGGQKNADALAHNKTVQKAAEVLEGSIAERAKLALMRATSAHIAAKEMNYPGGGEALMKHLMEDPTTMSPEGQADRLEAASKIVYHMNQMVGYSPGGYRDLNVFGRLSMENPLLRWFTPFTTTRIQQSRVLTKFFSNAAKAAVSGDGVKAATNVAQGLTMLGTIAMIGGRAAVPRDIQDRLREVDPELAKEVLERFDQFNIIGRALDTEVEHVTPQLMVPLFLGDSFPVQLLKAADDSVFAKPGSAAQFRGAATILASLGIASIGDRMGFNSIMKLHKAFTEGSAGEYTQWISREGSTMLSAAKAGAQLTQTGKHLGLPVEPARVNDLLGSRKVKTNLPSRVGNVLKTGLNITAAEIVNKTRDDNAFGDALSRMAPELYKKLAAQNRKLSIGAYKASSDEQRQMMEGHLEGFWERAYHDYMHKRHSEHEQEKLATGNVEA